MNKYIIKKQQQFKPLLFFVCIQFVLISYVVSCVSTKKASTVQTTPYNLLVPFFPDSLNIPADNPMTVEGVTLGRYLFYDGRLSGRTTTDSLMSCATCHRQEYSFECGISNPNYPGGKTFGLTGRPTPHVTMPLINLAWIREGYMWNGFVHESNTKLGGYKNVPSENEYHYRNIESFVWMMIVSPHECDGTIERSVAAIQQDPMYMPLFRKAFGDDAITIERISKAIAQFVRSIVSFNSRFDRFMRHETQLTDAEMRGFFLFESEKGDCFHCHGSPAMPLWTTNMYMNNAKDVDSDDASDRSSVTGNPMDKGKYRVPTLRNIAFTAPYMHDGRYKTLDDVLEFYNSGLKRSPYVDPLMINMNHGGMHLSPSEIQDLKAFLLTLTDTSLLTNPAYSNPMPENKWFIH